MNLLLLALAALTTALGPTPPVTLPHPSPSPVHHRVEYATVPSALLHIAASTARLRAAVVAYDPAAVDTLAPVIQRSVALLLDIDAGTRVAAGTPTGEPDPNLPPPPLLTEDEALEVAAAAGLLASEVDAAVDALVRARPRFDATARTHHAALMVRSIIDVQRDAALRMGRAVMARTPADFMPVAASIVKQIDDKFAEGAAAYKSAETK